MRVAGVAAAEERVVRAIEGQVWADRLAEPIQRPVNGALERLPMLRAVLNGTWLGRPVRRAPRGRYRAGDRAGRRPRLRSVRTGRLELHRRPGAAHRTRARPDERRGRRDLRRLARR